MKEKLERREAETETEGNAEEEILFFGAFRA